MPAYVGLWCVAALLGVAALGVVTARRVWGAHLVYGSSLLVSLAGLVSALWNLLTGAAPETLSLDIGLPGVGANFRLDALGAFFLLVTNLGGSAASLYALGYGRHEISPRRVLPFFPAYLAGMNLVVFADDAFSFLFAWQLMALSSWALVMAGHHAPENARAGFIYLLMASFGTLALLLAFGLLAGPDGGYAFATMRGHHPDSFTGSWVLLLALIGAGSKAGLVPLHVALPLAHPAAPSHVSALMSGVMTKIAIYAFIRIVFDLIGEPAWWTSLIVLAFASITAVVGILSAMMQSDLKRLLAYSTVENVGVVFIGLGLALAFRANGMALPAALALTAVLFHVLNHSIFKSLLFFGAGAVSAATGARDMEQLGGLIHRMPRTSAAFLVGCAAISALPPFNGFVSQWLTFQAILVGPGVPQWGMRFMIPTVGAMLALSAALAAACFVKAYGVVFLGRLRTPQAERAQEADRFSLAAMWMLAALCLVAGVLPGLFIDMLGPAVEGLVGARLPVQTFVPWASIVPIANVSSSYSGLLILLFVAVSGAVVAILIHRHFTRATRRSDIWDCGYPDPPAAAQYTGSSFAMPIRRVFGASMFLARESVDMPRPGEARAAHFHVKIVDPAWRYLYGPTARAVMRTAFALNPLQSLTIRNCLALVFATLLTLLLVVAAWR